MESLGEFLKRERELRNVTLEEISSATKISMRHLDALEQEKYDLLPTETFVKGFLRAYAHYIGIDPDEVILIYQENKEQHVDSLKMSKSLSSPSHQSGSKIFVASLLSLFLLTAFLFYFFLEVDGKWPSWKGMKTLRATEEQALLKAPPLRGEPQDDSSAQPPMVQKPLEAEKKGQQGNPGGMGEQIPTATVDGERKEGGETSPEAADYFILTAAAQSDTWLRVTIDEQEQHDLLLHSGKTANWQAKEKIVLTVGNVRGTRIDLNGKEIPLPSTTRNVLKDYVITRAMVP